MDIKERTSEALSPTATPTRNAGAGRIVLLAIGDAIVFIVFAVIGMRSHKEGLTVPSVLITAAPFAIGWFIVSPFIGAFRRNVTSQVGRMSARSALSWLAAWPVGLLLRGLTRHEVPPLTFALITLITNAIFLQLWRVPFAWVASRRER